MKSPSCSARGVEHAQVVCPTSTMKLETVSTYNVFLLVTVILLLLFIYKGP